MNIKGIVHAIMPEKKITEKLTKREFVLRDNSSKYEQLIMLQLINQNCSLLDSISIGDEIDVQFNLKGNEWQSPSGEIKYFNSLEAWKINSTNSNTQMSEESEIQRSAPNLNGDSDDLPF